MKTSLLHIISPVSLDHRLVSRNQRHYHHRLLHSITCLNKSKTKHHCLLHSISYLNKPETDQYGLLHILVISPVSLNQRLTPRSTTDSIFFLNFSVLNLLFLTSDNMLLVKMSFKLWYLTRPSNFYRYSL